MTKKLKTELENFYINLCNLSLMADFFNPDVIDEYIIKERIPNVLNLGSFVTENFEQLKNKLDEILSTNH